MNLNPNSFNQYELYQGNLDTQEVLKYNKIFKYQQHRVLLQYLKHEIK